MGLFDKLFGGKKESLPEQTVAKKGTDGTIKLYVVYKDEMGGSVEEVNAFIDSFDELWNFASIGESGPVDEKWVKQHNAPLPSDTEYPYFLLYPDSGMINYSRPYFHSGSEEEVIQFLEKYESEE